MQEIFKDIPNYEGLYQVSNLGNVKSLERKVSHYKGGVRLVKEKLLSQRISEQKYKQVLLYKKGKRINIQVHQLVAMAFLKHKINGHKLVVDHINNIKTDNRLENLQIITQRLNMSKDKKNKTSKYTGVSWKKSNNKWQSQIYKNKKYIYLGLFKNEYDAYLAYQKALKSLT